MKIFFSMLLCSTAAFAQVSADQSYLTYGVSIGTAEIQVSTVNGQTEIIVPCGSDGPLAARYWIVHRYNATTMDYAQVWASPIYAEDNAIMQLKIADAATAPGPEVVLATAQGRIEAWNQASRTLAWSFTTNLNPLAIAIDDCDGDGDPDVVVATSSSVTAFDTDGTVIWSLPGTGGARLAIGQMDNDPSPEVAVSDGTVIDCTTGTVQWQHPNSFGLDHAAADIDGDGRLEIIARPWFSDLHAFDVELQTAQWTLNIPGSLRIEVANVDSDPEPELLLDDIFFDEIHIIDLTTLTEDAVILNSRDGITSIATGDTDGDGEIEIVFGAGYQSTAPDQWFVASATTQSIEWRSPDIEHGLIGPVRGDIDNDGTDELICAANDQGFLAPRLLIFDADTLQLEHVSPPLYQFFTQDAIDIELADIDNDGDVEIFVVDGRVRALDWTGSSWSEVWQHQPGSFDPDFRRVRIADLNGNGTPQVVLGSLQFTHVIDYGASQETWRSFFTGPINQLEIANSDLTSEPEIHALSWDGNIYIFDGATLATEAVLQDVNAPLRSMHVVDGLGALLAGDELGQLYLYLNDGTNYLSIGPLPAANGPITDLGYYPSIGLLHVATDERVALQFGLTPDWLTLDYGTSFGRKVSLDVPSARLVTVGEHGLFAFEL